MRVREAEAGDLEALLELYTHLHEQGTPPVDDKLLALWDGILRDANHHVLVGEDEGMVVASCVLLVVPNLTRGPRPYALVENVVTHRAWRRRGCALQLLAQARCIAEVAGCYKMMLMSGAKDEGTLGFYERAGFNRWDKTAFVQWLGDLG